MNELTLSMAGPKPQPVAAPTNGRRTAVGFSSPADDYLEHPLDLNAHLIRHRAATFFIRSESDTPESIGVNRNDLLIVDRALAPSDGALAVAVCSGRMVLRRVRSAAGVTFLEGDEQPELFPDDGERPEIWGVVTHTIRAM